MYGCHRIISRDHNQVGRIQVNAHAARTAQRIQEIFERFGCFGTCLNGKMRADGVGIRGELSAGFLHDTVALMGRIGGNHADMRGDNARLHVLGQIQNALGFFDELRIERRIAEAVPQIPADCGKAQSGRLYHIQQFAPFFRRHVFGCVFPVCAVHLNSLHAQFCRTADGVCRWQTERLQHYADRE